MVTIVFYDILENMQICKYANMQLTWRTYLLLGSITV